MYHPVLKNEETLNYVAQLTYYLEEAYEWAHKCTGMKEQGQKQYYNKQVHGLPHEVATQVWFHQSAVASYLGAH